MDPRYYYTERLLYIILRILPPVSRRVIYTMCTIYVFYNMFNIERKKYRKSRARAAPPRFRLFRRRARPLHRQSSSFVITVVIYYQRLIDGLSSTMVGANTPCVCRTCVRPNRNTPAPSTGIGKSSISTVKDSVFRTYTAVVQQRQRV